MKAEFPYSEEIVITLSRRNLLALLHKIDMPDSKRTIAKDCDGMLVVVKSEEDEDHYTELPGEMHPDTEKFIREN